MPAMRDRAPVVSEDTEEGRALLQARMALFWKVMFWNGVLSGGLGALGAIVKPGLELVVGVVLFVQAGVLWRFCARGVRSVGLLRALETAGLLVSVTANAVLGRYVVTAFAREHALSTAEGVLMTDAYVVMLHIAGIGLLLAVRAALVPSAPRRTVGLTAVVGAPLVGSVFLVPVGGHELAWRGGGSAAYPWLPATSLMMWGFVVITCTVISWVIFGLRVEIRAARKLGQYVLEEKIGEGGMGEVYRARHGMLRRPAALKLMRSGAAASQLSRFEREVQLTARLTHPNTVTIYDYGQTHDGIFYYVMELLDGATLQRVVTVDGAQEAGRVVRILTMACRALTEAHAVGLIHRDIKPANIMLSVQGGERDVVKLLDFGLVKELTAEVSEEGEAKLTGATTLMGTPQYMAPESILAADATDARSDIYALGLVGYYLLAGVDVFTGRTIVEICGKHVHQAPSPFSVHGVRVPDDLEAVILACLEKDPSRRPQSAAELRERIEACAVEPWSAARVDGWWEERAAVLGAAPKASAAGERTIDLAPRAALA